MAAGYAAAGKTRQKATFELFFRRLPQHRKFILAAGLAQAAEYLLNLRFNEEQIAYLRTLPVMTGAPEQFFQLLAGLRFSGDLFAVPEGTPVFANEPILTVRAPLVEAQIVETYLLASIGFPSMIASKAARVVEAAAGRAVVEFGSRRAHGPEAGLLAARAAYIGGCIGTSNTEAGHRFGVPVYGTSAHSWVQSFPTEQEAFMRLQQLLGPHTVQLIDTYDTLDGARRAAKLGRPLWGVRLDSGNLLELSRATRAILDEAGLHDAKIMASGDLSEHRIAALLSDGAPIDAFGVGTELATSSDQPYLNAVYKLVELETEGIKRYTAKFSADKQTLPGAKQVFRFPTHDMVGCSWECPECDSGNVEALLRPVIIAGKLVEPLPTAEQARQRAAASIPRLPAEPRVEFSSDLLALYEKGLGDTR